MPRIPRPPLRRYPPGLKMPKVPKVNTGGYKSAGRKRAKNPMMTVEIKPVKAPVVKLAPTKPGQPHVDPKDLK